MNIEIPTLLFWENGNSWYGSLKNARFFIKPEPSEDGESKQISVRLWRGPQAMQLSEILFVESFSLSAEGLTQASAWLEEQAAALND